MDFKRWFATAALVGALAGSPAVAVCGAEAGFEGGARLLAGGGPYGAMLFHFCPCRFVRVGIGFGYYDLAYTAGEFGVGTYHDVSGRPFFLSAEAVWPGLPIAPKLHVEAGGVTFSFSEYYKMKKYSYT